MKPEELLYAETHEWVHVGEESGAKIATIGISAFAIEQLQDVTMLELPETGTAVTAEGEFGEVESVKSVNSLYSPVDGEVIGVNEKLPDHLEWLNDDPYGQAWIVKVRISDEAGLSKLMDYTAYQKQCAEEG